jgi:RHS repeat-associated protein
MPLITGSMQKQLLVGPASMVVRRNGWLYVYVSNESNQNVFFDNLVINHTRGPVVEKKEFYPFGMEIPGLSTQAFKSKYDQNRYKYNGIEYDSAFGLNEYEAHFRDLDPEIGRWNQMDPKVDYEESPYNSMGNNPILRNDPLGDKPECCETAQAIVQTTEMLSAQIIEAGGGAGDVVTDVAAGFVDLVGFLGAGITALAELAAEKRATPLPANLTPKAIAPAVTKAAPATQVKTETQKVGTIYKVPGSSTSSGKPYIGRHNKPNPAKTRKSNDGRDRSKADVIDKYDPNNVPEGRAKEQKAIDENGGVNNLDNKRNEIKKDPPKDVPVDPSKKNENGSQ